jgi:RecA-family ATPase
VDGAFLAGTVAMMSGDGGLGKSLLMQQLATAAALGRKWVGFATKPCRTLAIFCEDDRDELHRRQEAINRHYDCGMSDLEDVIMQDRAGRDSVMVGFDKWGSEPKTTAIYEAIEREVEDFGVQILILDTRRAIFRGNEIDYQQAAATITTLRRLAIKMQGAVILTDHPSNEGLASGSGISGNRAWSNSVRSRLYLHAAGKKEDEKPNERVLRTVKSNYAPRGKIDLKWENGVFVKVETEWWSEPID